MKNLSRHKRIIIVSGVGAAVAIVLMLATGADESRHRVKSLDAIAAAGATFALETFSA
ncbi:MAG: hypothetical protein ACTSWM_01240 [Alphaproteobacteria bacterium]